MLVIIPVMRCKVMPMVTVMWCTIMAAVPATVIYFLYADVMCASIEGCRTCLCMPYPRAASIEGCRICLCMPYPIAWQRECGHNVGMQSHG
jgi:hypothetical protein